MYFNPPLLESLSMNGVQEIRLSLQESLGCHKAFARVESGSLVFFNGLRALMHRFETICAEAPLSPTVELVFLPDDGKNGKYWVVDVFGCDAGGDDSTNRITLMDDKKTATSLIGSEENGCVVLREEEERVINEMLFILNTY